MKYFLIAFMIVLLGCNQHPEADSLAIPEMEFEAQGLKEDAARSQQQPAETVERKLIREGEIEFESEDVAQSTLEIKARLEAVGGYLSLERSYSYANRNQTVLEVRVPAGKFDSFLAEVSKGVKRFDRKEIRTRDVTEEYLDLETRIKNKKGVEARFMEILQQANSVSDILEVERQAAQVREEIERMEGRLKYLKNQVGFSTLSITVYEITAAPVHAGPSFFTRVGNGFTNGINLLKEFLIGLVSVWPLWIVLAIGIAIWRRRKKQKKQAPDQV